MTLMLVGMPIVLLLLFVYVFGGQLGAGLGAHQGRSATSTTSFRAPSGHCGRRRSGHFDHVRHDMTGGIIDRFRTMAIAAHRSSPVTCSAA